jgi:hypothetical protein
MNKSERFQQVFHEYEAAHNNMPSSTRNVVRWAVEKGLLTPPVINPEDILAEQMARSLREERKPDAQGRLYRVNHAAQVMKDGVQYTLWSNIDSGPREHIEMSFGLRRDQIIGDCHQLKVDVDRFNTVRLNGEQYELILDFTDDVAERELNSKFFE